MDGIESQQRDCHRTEAVIRRAMELSLLAKELLVGSAVLPQCNIKSMILSGKPCDRAYGPGETAVKITARSVTTGHWNYIGELDGSAFGYLVLT